jgi:hypothetical protein
MEHQAHSNILVLRFLLEIHFLLSHHLHLPQELGILTARITQCLVTAHQGVTQGTK